MNSSMRLRDSILFIVLFVSFITFLNLIPLIYFIVEKSSILFISLIVTYWLMKTMKKTFFNKKLPAANKAVFITGCDSGFGHELAKRMDFLGYKVYAGCLQPNSEGALHLIETCPDVVVVPIDVTSEKSVQDARNYVTENLGEKTVLWALVNNAGITQSGEMDWAPIDEIEAVIAVNTLGVVRVTKAFLPLLKASRGRIVNNTSSVGRFICPGFIGYCMSKSAAITFTEGLRVEMLKWNIKVISIEPFFYKTPLVKEESIIERVEKSISKIDPLTRQAYGEDYFKRYKSKCKRTVKLSSSKIYQVINCFEDAITAEEPDPIYFSAYLPHKLGIYLLQNLPLSVADNFKKDQLDYGSRPADLCKRS